MKHNMGDRSIPSLDGARAVAILIVIVAHLALKGSIPHAQALHQFDFGNYGVRVFFVISGFLITTLLLREESASGAISLRNFYLRRAFRIFPAYYAFLIATLIMGRLGMVNPDPAQFPAAAFYIANYTGPNTVWDHTWSLSVEEQFYLLWPIALAWLGVKAGARVAIAVMIISPLFRLALTYGHWFGDLNRSFECCADALAAGCLLAVYQTKLVTFRPYSALVNSPLLVPCAVAFLIITRLTVNDTVIWNLLKVTAYNTLIMMVLHRYMLHPKTWVGSLLNWKPVAYIGTISYSLYLWQQPAIFNNFSMTWEAQVAAAFVAALFSYYLVERPLLQLRKRFVIGSGVRAEQALTTV
jgi:peptidoglycan/LPS O-acetylase OafA/YrhL